MTTSKSVQISKTIYQIEECEVEDNGNIIYKLLKGHTTKTLIYSAPTKDYWLWSCQNGMGTVGFPKLVTPTFDESKIATSEPSKEELALTPCDPVETLTVLSAEAIEILSDRRDRFESRKERRLGNALSGALRNRKLSTAIHQRSREMGSCIPMGQPILIGHHSEQRDRRFRKRLWNMIGKAVEANDKADYYSAKAAVIESNQTIYSDDPDAILKLQEKIDLALANQEHWKAGNKIVKSKKLTSDQKVAQLTAAGHSSSLLEPDWCGRLGYADYLTTNNSANIRRMRQRLQELERTLVRAVELGDTEQEYPELNLVVKQARTLDLLQLIFDGKPSLEVRTLLKSSGFRWAPSESAWQRKLPESDLTEKAIIAKIRSLSI